MEIIIEVDKEVLESKLNHRLSNDIILYFLKSSEESLSGNIASHTPVLTGALRDSWTPRLEERELHVTTSKHYAGFVESGTRYFSGRHMAEFGAEQFKQRIPQLITRAFYIKGLK